MSISGVPDAPDESCRHRETVRLPRSTASEIQRLVDEGRYPNRSAAIRAGVRLLIEYEAAEETDSAGGATDHQSGDAAPEGRGDDPTKDRRGDDPTKDRRGDDPTKDCRGDDPTKDCRGDDPATTRRGDAADTR